jgi:hypothetical protein
MAILLSLILLISNKMQAQVKTIAKNISKYGLYYNGGIGIFTPFTNKNASLDIVYSFQAQVNYKDKFMGRLFFNQFNTSVTHNAVQNGLQLNYTLKSPVVIIGMDGGYTLYNKNKLSINTALGVGYAGLKSLHTDIDTMMHQIKITEANRHRTAFTTNIAPVYKFNRYFILSAEFQYIHITDFNTNLIRGLNIQLNFKTPLQ